MNSSTQCLTLSLKSYGMIGEGQTIRDVVLDSGCKVPAPTPVALNTDERLAYLIGRSVTQHLPAPRAPSLGTLGFLIVRSFRSLSLFSLSRSSDAPAIHFQISSLIVLSTYITLYSYGDEPQFL